MSVFKVNIDGFGDLPVTPPFTPRSEPDRRPNGQVVAVRDIWRFRGVLPADITGATGLKAKRDALLAAFTSSAPRVRFLVNGTPFETIGQPVHPRGAFFRNFNVQESGAEWVNLLVYDFEVFGERPADIPGVVEADVDDEVSVDASGNVRRTVRAQARGPGAEAFVLAQKPGAVESFRITRSKLRDTVSGTFEVSSTQGDSGVTVEETVTVEPGLFPLEYVRPSRSDKPVPIFSSRTPSKISIEGRIRAASGKRVSPVVPKSRERFLVQPFSVRAESIASEQTTETSFTLTFEVGEPVAFSAAFAERDAIPLSAYLAAPNDVGVVVR